MGLRVKPLRLLVIGTPVIVSLILRRGNLNRTFGG
jgi:hypothetical protein